MSLSPVQRREGESRQWYGKRRKAQIREWYHSGHSIELIAQVHGVTPGYVREAVGIASPSFRWEPPREVLEGPFPSLDEARADVPLVVSDRHRMSTEQAIQRAVQMYRWMMAGMTLREIGVRHGISRERVRRILDKFGLGSRWNPRWKSGTPRELPAIRDPLSKDFWRRER